MKMKKIVKIGGFVVCFISILYFNIDANLNTSLQNVNLSTLAKITVANAEYGNGKDGRCSDGCPMDMVMIWCFDKPDSYCVPTNCQPGFCD